MSSPVVILLPIFERFTGIVQCAKLRFIEAFIPQLAVEAFDEAVLLALSWSNVMPIDTSIL